MYGNCRVSHDCVLSAADEALAGRGYFDGRSAFIATMQNCGKADSALISPANQLACGFVALVRGKQPRLDIPGSVRRPHSPLPVPIYVCLRLCFFCFGTLVHHWIGAGPTQAKAETAAREIERRRKNEYYTPPRSTSMVLHREDFDDGRARH